VLRFQTLCPGLATILSADAIRRRAQSGLCRKCAVESGASTAAVELLLEARTSFPQDVAGSSSTNAINKRRWTEGLSAPWKEANPAPRTAA
jgi:hypothetical protein